MTQGGARLTIRWQGAWTLKLNCCWELCLACKTHSSMHQKIAERDENSMLSVVILIKDNIVLCFRKSSKSPKVNSAFRHCTNYGRQHWVLGTDCCSYSQLDDKVCPDCTTLHFHHTGELTYKYILKKCLFYHYDCSSPPQSSIWKQALAAWRTKDTRPYCLSL